MTHSSPNEHSHQRTQEHHIIKEAVTQATFHPVPCALEVFGVSMLVVLPEHCLNSITHTDIFGQIKKNPSAETCETSILCFVYPSYSFEDWCIIREKVIEL